MTSYNKYDPERECDRIMHRIVDICRTRGISQTALAKAADLSKSTVHDLFNDKNKPYMFTIYKLCNALEISVKLLLEDEISKDGNDLASDELDLLMRYSNMSKGKKQLLRIFVEMLADYDDMKIQIGSE